MMIQTKAVNAIGFDSANGTNSVGRPRGSQVALEDALNVSLGDYRIICGEGSKKYAVYPLSSPACRGEGETLKQAMDAARRELNRQRNARVALSIDRFLRLHRLAKFLT